MSVTPVDHAGFAKECMTTSNVGIARPAAAVVAFALVTAWAAAPVTTAPAPHAGHDAAAVQCLLLADPQVHRSYVPARTPRASLATAPAPERSASIAVTYVGFTPEARAAFQFAVDIWATQLASPVPMSIDAQFQDLGIGVLGTVATGSFEQAVPGGIPGTFYPAALANRLAAVDLQPARPDIFSRFSSNVNWYYGTDGNAPAGSYDFITAVLHELGHGLGFTGSGWMTVGGRGMWGFGNGPLLPGIFDRFVINGAGQAFIDTALFPNPSAELAAQITGNNLFFNGPQARAANGNTAPRLYAPTSWASSSSYSHLNEATYGVGTANSLMTPFLASGEAIHDPGPVVHGMFRDMGWLVAGTSCTYALSRTPASFAPGGGTGSVTIGTGAGCGWAVTSDASWLTFTSTSAAAGPSAVSFAVAANPSSVARSTTIRAGGQAVTVTQAGVPCTFAVSNLLTFGARGGPAALPVTASAPDCAFAAATGTPWLSISGTQVGSATLTITAGAAGAATRTGSLTVAGVAVTVRQNGHATGTFDINNDGAADLLAYDPVSGARFFAFGDPRNLGFTAGATSTWASGWTVLPGDFNADGRADLFFYNAVTGRAIKAVSTATEVFAYTEISWSPGWQVTIADLNGDGSDDAFVYNTASGRWFRCISQPDGSFAYTNSGTWSPSWSIYTGDFNGDGRADLFLYNATSDANAGRTYRVLSNADESVSFIAGDLTWSNNWTITPGDFDGNGRTDLFLYRPTGEWYRVFFTGSAARYESGVAAAGLTVSPGDFNGDARTDLFVYNPASGLWYVAISEANGTLSYFGGIVNWSPGWQVFVTDVNVDGVSDLVLYNPADGRWFQAVTQSPGVFAFGNGMWATGTQITATRPQ